VQAQQIAVAGGYEAGFRGKRASNNSVIIGVGRDSAGDDRRGNGTR
jgi:hypothetical protein